MSLRVIFSVFGVHFALWEELGGFVVPHIFVGGGEVHVAEWLTFSSPSFNHLYCIHGYFRHGFLCGFSVAHILNFE